MHGRFRKWIWVFAPLMASLFFVACDGGPFNSLKSNTAPTIQITSFAGDSLSVGENGDAYVDSTVVDTVLFQQKIYWAANDVDGVIKGYAYRVLDGEGNPIKTAGNEVTTSDGWIYHYKPGVTNTIPLEGNAQSEKVRTIWSTIPNATINFPAHNVDGVATPTPSVFEVKCIDNRGTESQIARKVFMAESHTPTITLSSSKGDVDGETVGTALRMQFTMSDAEQFVTDDPDWYYEYRVYKVDIDNGTMISGSDTGWISNKGDSNIRETVVYGSPTSAQPASLTSDFNSAGTQITKTVFSVRGYDISGIVSNVVSNTFTVKDTFYPSSLIYEKNINALGANHFVDVLDSSIGTEVPYQTVSGETQYATPFFRNLAANYVALYSSDFRAWLYWGYKGEYAGDVYGGKRNSTVLDKTTSSNYYCEVKNYDIQIDGQPFYFAPFAADPDYVSKYLVTDADGTWLRIPLNQEITQELVLSNISATDPNNADDYHIIKMRVVDLQGHVDPSPAVFKFKLDSPMTESEKSGVLVIDDDSHQTFSPDAAVLGFYDYALGDIQHTTMNRTDVAANTNVFYPDLHFGRDAFSPTDLQAYKMILWHSDYSPATQGDQLWKEYDTINLYMRNGGNLVLSGGANTQNLFINCNENGFSLFHNYLGFENSLVTNPVSFIDGNVTSKPYFTGATSHNATYPNINIGFLGDDSSTALSTTLYNLIHPLGGMGTVAYFDQSVLLPTAEVVYTMNIKPTGTDNHSPNATDYAAMHDQPCGILYPQTSVSGSAQSTFFLGFPLSYMDRDNAKSFISAYWNHVNNQ